jgi:asparagine synthetase B (glutamine-hydrolysing)
MCGISTVVTLRAHASKPNLSNTNGTHDVAREYRKILENDIDASLQRIAHRGPDSRGIWMSERGQVGKRYLIIY